MPDPSWSGSCRELVLRLDDGSEHTALFDFRQARAAGEPVPGAPGSIYPGCPQHPDGE